MSERKIDMVVQILLYVAMTFFFVSALISSFMGINDKDLLIIGMIFMLMSWVYQVMQEQRTKRVMVRFLGGDGKEIASTVICEDCAERLKTIYSVKESAGECHER